MGGVRQAGWPGGFSIVFPTVLHAPAAILRLNFKSIRSLRGKKGYARHPFCMHCLCANGRGATSRMAGR
eukprot:10631869-Karenia_brevis.AAC.1